MRKGMLSRNRTAYLFCIWGRVMKKFHLGITVTHFADKKIKYTLKIAEDSTQKNRHDH
jgi:hypothetical protein